MKKILLILLSLAFTSGVLYAKESRREIRKAREKERMEEVLQMFRNREFRFVARAAHPMGGGTIHLTSLYNLDVVNDSLSAWLPFFGVAYSADYGGDGGIKFNEKARLIKFQEKKRGNEIVMEVRTTKEFYRLHLSITRSGFATLVVSGTNRQSINFSGSVEKLPQEVNVRNY